MEDIKTLIGYWNKDINNPIIKFNIPVEGELSKYILVSIDLKPLPCYLSTDSTLGVEFKKLNRGLKKLAKSMEKIKYVK